ncbi:HB2L protein, partial [Sterrhoptilus dennistouni]|nr:HB2L protein [Sterrhoptilus dennistouni]
PPDLCPAHPGVFQEGHKAECHFINGTEKVRFVQRHSYNREQDAIFDSEVGHFVGYMPWGEKRARHWNSDPKWMEYIRDFGDSCCWQNYMIYASFSVER